VPKKKQTQSAAVIVHRKIDHAAVRQKDTVPPSFDVKMNYTQADKPPKVTFENCLMSLDAWLLVAWAASSAS
jgi:hypothetical protein